MNRVLGMILTLVFSLTIVFASADLNVTKNVSSNDLNQGDTITITFDLTAHTEIIERHNLDVMITLDKSGSMGDDNKLTDAQNAAIEFINNLDPIYDKVGLVGFSENLWKKNAKLYSSLTTNFDNVKNQINSLTANGGTNTGDGILKSNNELNSSSNVKVQILLSDGLPTYPFGDGDESDQEDYDYALEQAQISADNNIVIYTISLGQDADQEFMNHIAELTNGKHYYAPNSSDLTEIFNEIKEEVNSLTTSNIVITDVLPEGVDYIYETAPEDCDFNLESRTVTCIISALTDGESDSVAFEILVKEYNLNYVNEYTEINYTTEETEKQIIFTLEQQPSVNVTNTIYANDDNAEGNENQNLEISVLENDFDYDDFFIINYESEYCDINTRSPNHGSIGLSEDNTKIIYEPNLNFFGEDKFQYAITDGNLIDCALVTINILPINDAPILKDINNYSVTQNKTLEFNINATDFDSNILRFKIDENYNWLELIDNNNNSAKIILKPTTNTIPGNYNLNIFVYDDYNAFDTKVSTITVIKKTVTPPTGGGGGGSSGGSSGSNIIGECIPEVRYSDWSKCINGKQTRTYEIINSCENQTIDLLEKPCFIFEEQEKIVNEIITDNNNIDLNTNQLTTPTGLVVLGNGLIPGIITMILLLLGYAGYKIYNLKKKALL